MKPSCPQVLLAKRAERSRSDVKDHLCSLDAGFLLQGSPLLLQQLRDFVVANFGFGAFDF